MNVTDQIGGVTLRILVLIGILQSFYVDTMMVMCEGLVRNIVIVGGTHGNEYTGVWCIRELEAAQQQQQQQQEEDEKITTALPTLREIYPSLEISSLLGNPKAHAANQRFVDADLNRQFSKDRLFFTQEASTTVEGTRARKLNQLLGPKFLADGSLNEDPATDVIIDLHSTTTNMGIALIVPETDSLMAQAAAYVLSEYSKRKHDTKLRILMHALPDRSQRPNVGSLAKHGFTIEVGPIPQGIVRQDVTRTTQLILHLVLEFLHLSNNTTITNQVKSSLLLAFPMGRVPCFRSAPAQRPGEMSGKISWPSHEQNNNFPLWMIHPSIQDKDFLQLIRIGDPLFTTIHNEIIRYEGSHGDQVYLMFINEGGYYYSSSGTGIGVAVPAEFDLQTGRLLAQPSSSHVCSGKNTNSESDTQS